MALRVFALVCSYPPLHLRLFVQMRKFVDEWSTFSPVGLLNFLLFFLAVRAISSWPTAYLVLPIFFLSFFAPFFSSMAILRLGVFLVCVREAVHLYLFSLSETVCIWFHTAKPSALLSRLLLPYSPRERERGEMNYTARPPYYYTILL